MLNSMLAWIFIRVLIVAAIIFLLNGFSFTLNVPTMIASMNAQILSSIDTWLVSVAGVAWYNPFRGIIWMLTQTLGRFALFVVEIYIIVWALQYLALGAKNMIFGTSKKTIPSEILRVLAMGLSILASIAMTVYAYSIFYGDVKLFETLVLKGYVGRQIGFEDAMWLGVIGGCYAFTQVLPLAFRPSKATWRGIDILTSAPFVVMIMITFVLFQSGLHENAKSTYRMGALYMWAPIALIDAVHMVVAIWHQRGGVEASQAPARHGPAPAQTHEAAAAAPQSA
jgi:hypothetical protein